MKRLEIRNQSIKRSNIIMTKSKTMKIRNQTSKRLAAAMRQPSMPSRPKKPIVEVVEVAPQQKPRRAPKAAAVGSAFGSGLASLLPAPFNALASPLLGKLGDWAGDKVGTFLGTGDYQVNSLIDGVRGVEPSRNNGISYVHSENDSIVLTRREYIGDVISAETPGDFKITRYRIQAANRDLFKYLSTVARLHQQWEPRGMVLQYKSNTGLISSAATPNVGVVVMATEYDASIVAPFTDKNEMENSWGGCSVMTTEHLAYGVECKYKKNVLENLLVDNDELNESENSPSFYDLGTFCIATVGQPAAAQNCGELWISYDIVLSKPKLNRETYGDPRCAQWRMNLVAAGTWATGRAFVEENADLLDPAITLAGDDNAFLLNVETPAWLDPSEYTAGSLLNFTNMTPGTYQILLLQGLVATGAGDNMRPSALSDRCTVGPLGVTAFPFSSTLVGGQPSGTLAYSTPQTTTTTSNLQMTVFAIEVTAVSPTIVIYGSLPRTIAWSWLQVMSIPRSQTSFSIGSMFRMPGSQLELPSGISPDHRIRFRPSAYRNTPPTLETLKSDPEKVKRKKKITSLDITAKSFEEKNEIGQKMVCSLPSGEVVKFLYLGDAGWHVTE
jgi:hypothetical protein